jgi:putative glutamine amidotransferase
MKKSLHLIIIIFALFISCSQDKAPVIGMTMSYWEGNYSINKTYVDAIRDNGARVRLIPCTEDKALIAEEIKDCDGFVFIGGRDYIPGWYGKDMHPSMVTMDLHRAAFDTLFMRMGIESGKPVLGICAGEQLMNIATGGKLFRDIPDHRGVEHWIYPEPGSMIHGLYGDSMIVNSWHHQCVDPAFLNDDFTVTAWSADSIVECIEYQGDQWLVGTQFHPERLPEKQRDKLISLFIHECWK